MTRKDNKVGIKVYEKINKNVILTRIADIKTFYPFIDRIGLYLYVLNGVEGKYN